MESDERISKVHLVFFSAKFNKLQFVARRRKTTTAGITNEMRRSGNKLKFVELQTEVG